MLHFTEFKFEDSGSKKAVLIDIPINTALNDIASTLHSHHRNQLLSVDLILLRLSVWEPLKAGAQENNVKEICDRFPNISVRLLVSDGYEHLILDGVGNEKIRKFQFEGNPQPFLNNLRTEELKQLVEQSDALYLSDVNYVFQLPSRSLSNSFLRVGNIQTSRGALDSLLFWLLPHLRGVEGILIDTWSISSIALNISRYISSCKLGGRDFIRVEMLDHYLDGRLQTREQLEDILRRVSDGFQKPFMILFSATMTGKSLEYFASALSLMNCPTKHQIYMVLFRVGDTPVVINNSTIPELCDYSSEVPSSSPTSDMTQKTQIKIDPTTYFPIFRIEKEINLKSNLAEKHKAFFNRYKDQHAIRIHVDTFVDGQYFRHHGIYIDVIEMLKNRHFFTKFKRAICELTPTPKIVLVPPHKAGKKLAEFASEQLEQILGVAPKIIERLDLAIPCDSSNDPKAVTELKKIHKSIKLVNEDESLLVLDDVVTTGSRFLGYQKELRKLGFKGQIHYRAGVCRTSTPSVRRSIARTLKPNNYGCAHTLDFVEEVILPNWDKKDCPLCTESSLLNELIKEKKILPNSPLSNRATLLRNQTLQGFVDDVFLHLPSTESLQITSNSFFVNEGATQAIVLSSVAAAIQELRNNTDTDNRLDARGFPIRKVFSIDDLSTYTDGILQASLMRCVYEEEFQRNSFEKDKQFFEWALEIFNKRDSDSLSTQPELALAVGLRRIPIDVGDSCLENSINKKYLSELLPVILAGRS